MVIAVASASVTTLEGVGRKSRAKWERREERRLDEGLRRAEAVARREAAELGAREGRRRGCLICRRTDGGFTSEEHIFPESLGNTDVVLPHGVVCDRCNHEVCAPVDEALCSFLPIETLRAAHGVPSKAGKLPSVRFDNGTLEATSADHILLTLDSEKWRKDLPAAPGRKAFSFTAQRHDITPKRLSRVHRALVKQALECAWLDHGEEVLGSEFDREREIILRGDHHGYLSTPNKVQFPDEPPQSGLQYRRLVRNSDGHPFLFLVASFLGAPIATDTLFERPEQTPPEEVLVWTF